MNRFADQVLGVLLRQEPREVLGSILDYLTRIGRGGAAVFRATGDSAELAIGNKISGQSVEWVERVWGEQAHRLRNGQAVSEGQRVLVPAVSDAGDVTLLYLENSTLAPEHAKEAVTLIASSFGQAETALPVFPFADPKELERATLLKLLEDHEWNISRVSRELGVVRNTIYQRIRRFKIERLKIPRALRGRRTTS